jgi:cytochrome P450
LRFLSKIHYSSTDNSTRQDTVLPLSTPIIGLDGREMNEISVPNNTDITISIYAANRNPEIWGPDSYDWKPERWLNPLPETVIDARIPGVYSHLYVLVAFCNALGTN